MKRIITMVLAVVMLAALFGCTPSPPATTGGSSTAAPAPATAAPASSAGAPAPTAASPEQATLAEKIAQYSANLGNFDTELTISTLWISNEQTDKSIFERVIKDYLNVVFEYTTIADSGKNEQINLLFAANDFPEIIYNLNASSFYTDVKQWGTNGYLLPINEYAESMPNYMALWGEQTWEDIKLFLGDSERNVYSWPSQNYREASRSWIYRMGMLEELGLTEPTTTEEYYQMLKAFKTEYPDSIPMLNRWGLTYLLEGFTSAFHTRYDFWAGNETREIEYGPASDEYRDMIVYLNKLYGEDLIDKEFLTTSDDQHKAYTATGRNIAEFSYSTRAIWGNQLLPEDAIAGWEWSPNYITAYPDKYEEGLAIRDEKFFTIGQIWTAMLTDDEKIMRLAAWLDFASTDEGADVSCYGIEGETFYRDENGHGRSMSETNAYLTNSNVYTGHPYLTRYSYGWMIDNDKLSDLEFSESISSKPYFLKVAYEYDSDQQARMATLKTQLTSIRDEWTSRFIMGTADPSDDAQWNNYLSALKEAGLEEALQINAETARVGS